MGSPKKIGQNRTKMASPPFSLMEVIKKTQTTGILIIELSPKKEACARRARPFFGSPVRTKHSSRFRQNIWGARGLLGGNGGALGLLSRPIPSVRYTPWLPLCKFLDFQTKNCDFF